MENKHTQEDIENDPKWKRDPFNDYVVIDAIDGSVIAECKFKSDAKLIVEAVNSRFNIRFSLKSEIDRLKEELSEMKKGREELREKLKCESCKGNGWQSDFLGESNNICPICDGSGIVDVLSLQSEFYQMKSEIKKVLDMLKDPGLGGETCCNYAIEDLQSILTRIK